MTRVHAPGRVNLIGEHVDYVGGLVLPCAIDRGITVRCTPATDGAITLASDAFPGVARLPLAGAAPVQGWGRYAGAVVLELRALGVPLRPLVVAIESDLPAGAGLSSSAALLVALALALLDAADAELDGLALAELCERAEHRAVGLPCGIMDQAASALAEPGCALLLDCGRLTWRHVPLPDDLLLAVIGSGVERRLEESLYAERAAEVAAALAALPPDGARTLDPAEALSLPAVRALPSAPRARLRHVLGERLRVEAVAAELERPGGPRRAELGRLFAAGHASMRDDFEASHPAVDRLVELAGEEGAIAARITGGGFGGAVVLLLDARDADARAARIAERHAGERGAPAPWFTTRPAAGARVHRPR